MHRFLPGICPHLHYILGLCYVYYPITSGLRQDHRNHGERLITPLANLGWHREPAENNSNHAIDMYAIQTGTAKDVSFLIDFLPSYLFPNGEREIDRWGVAGISLGGHSTWICLKNDPRVTIGIPIIGCPSFLTLMRTRAAQYRLSGPPTFPDSLVSYIEHNDPSSTEPNPSLNPFLGKKILILSGGADSLVPWEASKAFIEKLDLGENGVKTVFLEDGAGHQCTREMVKRLGEFMIKWGLNA
ncbi:Alpha/Beta hydrolase protein [Cantharellus anzutake]|uniref:Alpha/Beta hydrolase protein n=1 Tax=Cantharellus anzutake TaxID=1750568 RepID=UPI001902DDF0|nr:Alpha/Beta hydrolase protein [Cantharellus anzutake]KAF8313515.1 Alpha/Beta hydrolase protein [Cantharellus anzutake]